MPGTHTLYTIGHSTHPIDFFLKLLRMYRISAVGDVRSSPYSRYNPQYNREPLQAALERKGVAYVYLGRELGPRSDNPAHYRDGRVQYDRLRATALFRQGLERLYAGMKSYRIALMCAEKDPLACHRTILICRQLREDPALQVQHILADGSLESLADMEARLIRSLRLGQLQLFEKPEDQVRRAYAMQGERIAHVKADAGEEGEP